MVGAYQKLYSRVVHFQQARRIFPGPDVRVRSRDRASSPHDPRASTHREFRRIPGQAVVIRIAVVVGLGRAIQHQRFSVSEALQAVPDARRNHDQAGPCVAGVQFHQPALGPAAIPAVVEHDLDMSLVDEQAVGGACVAAPAPSAPANSRDWYTCTTGKPVGSHSGRKIR